MVHQFRRQNGLSVTTMLLSSMCWRNCRGLRHHLQLDERLSRVGLSNLQHEAAL